MRLAALVLGLALGCGPRPPALAPAATAPALPALAFPALDGTPWTSAAVAGKVAVIDVWATYCKPCKQAFPVLGKLAAERPDIAVIGLSLDEEDAPVQAFLAETPAGFTILRDRGQLVTQGPLAITQVPTLLVVDRAGKVRLRIDNAKEADYPRLWAIVDALRAEP